MEGVRRTRRGERMGRARERSPLFHRKSGPPGPFFYAGLSGSVRWKYRQRKGVAVKTYEVIFQKVVLYRLIVQAQDANEAEQAACDAFGEDDEAATEFFSAVDVLDVKETPP